MPESEQFTKNVIRIKYKRPYLYPRQQAIMFHDARFVTCEASTKSGKTHGCIVWLLEQAIFGKDHQNCWWVAPVYKQAKIAFRRMKGALRDHIKEGIVEVNETELWIKLQGAATVWFLSGEKPDNLYGEDVIACVIDEASRVRPESYVAVYSTLTATQGMCRMIGNVTNRSNWFYNLCRKAEQGRKYWAYDMITAYDAINGGVLKLEIIEEAKKDLTEQDFAALYLCIPPDDGGNPFGERYIQECITPLSGKEPVCWGIDLAKSGDFTYMIALDEDCNVCKYEKFQHDWTITKSIIPGRVAGLPCVIDSTGVGDSIVEDLQNESEGNFVGFKFSVQSKQQLMEMLAYKVQNKLVGFPDGDIAQQMRTITYEHTRLHVLYRVPDGMHDDAVMALGMACRAFENTTWSWTIPLEEVYEAEQIA